MIWTVFFSIAVLCFTHFLAWSIGRNTGYEWGYQAGEWQTDRDMAERAALVMASQRRGTAPTREPTPSGKDAPASTPMNSGSSEESSDDGSLGDRILSMQRGTYDRARRGIRSSMYGKEVE